MTTRAIAPDPLSCAIAPLRPGQCLIRVRDRRKTTLAKSVGELPLDPQQRTGTDGSDPLNVCATTELMHRNKKHSLDDLVGGSGLPLHIGYFDTMGIEPPFRWLVGILRLQSLVTLP